MFTGITLKMANDRSSSFVIMKVLELQNFLNARDFQIAVCGRKEKWLNFWSFAKMQPK